MMTSMNTKTPLAMVAAACVFLNGCASGVLRSDFYQPPPSEDKLPVKVSLVADPSLRTAHVRHSDIMVADVDLNPALLESVKRELTADFQDVALIEDPEKSVDSDLLVVASANVEDKSEAIVLSFKDPESGETIKVITGSAAMNRPQGGKELLGIGCVLSIGVLFPFCIWGAQGMVSNVEKGAEAGISESLSQISRSIHSESSLLEAVKEKRENAEEEKAAQAEAEELEKAGLALENKGNAKGALAKYAAALGKGLEAEDDLRIRKRILALAAGMNPPPAIPDEARSHTRRGLAFINKAEGIADFRDAAREFEQAVLLAPWYADGYVNLGLAREKAGDYEGAIESLRLYLAASPDAASADKVNAKIDDIEVSRQRASRER